MSIILELKRPAIGGSGLLVSPMIEKSTTGAVSGADEGELAHLVPQMIDESNTGSVSVANIGHAIDTLRVIDLSIILELKRPAIGGSGLLVSPMIEKSTTGAVSGADEGELAHLVPQMIDESNTGSVSVANDEAPASSDITAS